MTKAFAHVADGGRTIQDTLASAICHGMLDRFRYVSSFGLTDDLVVTDSGTLTIRLMASASSMVEVGSAIAESQGIA